MLERSESGELCAGSEPEPQYADSSWEEAADGVMVHDVIGIGEQELKRHGRFLENVNDGVVELFPSPQEAPYMTKAKLGACKEAISAHSGAVSAIHRVLRDTPSIENDPGRDFHTR